MAAEIDRAGGHMDVHQVVHSTALNMILNPVHQVPTANIEDLDIGKGAVDKRKTRAKLVTKFYKINLHNCISFIGHNGFYMQRHSLYSRCCGQGKTTLNAIVSSKNQNTNLDEPFSQSSEGTMSVCERKLTLNCFSLCSLWGKFVNASRERGVKNRSKLLLAVTVIPSVPNAGPI